MATLLGTLPSHCNSEMERRGDGSKPGLSALAEPRKPRTHRMRPPSPPLQTFRPLQGMRAASPIGGTSFSGRQLTPKGLSSRSLPSRGAGEGVILPPKGGSDRTLRQPKTPAAPARLAPPPHTHTPPQLGGAAASGTIPELQGGCRGRGREAAAPEQAAATASQSLLRSSAPTHPVLSIIAQLDFLAQAPRDLHSRRVRADAGILSSRRIAGGEAGGGGSGRRGLLALGSARAYVRTPSC